MVSLDAIPLALGIIIGILLSILVVLLNIRYAKPAERLVNQLTSTLKMKGKLLDPEDESVKTWVDQLPSDSPVIANGPIP